jgi:hypothetical protein
MRRSTLFSSVSSLLKVSSASALVLATVLSCTARTGPRFQMPDGVNFPDTFVLVTAKMHTWQRLATADGALDVSPTFFLFGVGRSRLWLRA